MREVGVHDDYEIAGYKVEPMDVGGPVYVDFNNNACMRELDNTRGLAFQHEA